MKVQDVMSAHPILVRADEQQTTDLHRLMEAGGVHHLPVIDGPNLLGVWVETADGSLVMLGRERVHETAPDADASEAMAALMGDAEAVVVWDAGVPTGMLTRADALAIVRTAIGRGIGRRHHRPIIVRLAGPAGAGKTTLLMRTLGVLDRLEVAVIQANRAAPDAEVMDGVPTLEEPGAHSRAGLARAAARLSDAQLILLEDLDAPPDLARGIGEDLQVAVVPASDVPELSAGRLTDAQAVVVTRADELSRDELQEAIEALRARCQGLAIFTVGLSVNDPGLEEWARWIEAQVLRRHS